MPIKSVETPQEALYFSMDNLIPTGRKWSFSQTNFIVTSVDFDYIQPTFQFEDEALICKSRYLIIAASGAVGKSAFGLHLAQTKNAMLWDLARLRLGSNTFIGSSMQAVGPENLVAFLSSINVGETLLVFDAFDEAELHSGWAGVQEFINEIVKYTRNARPASIIFLARRETADSLELTLYDLVSDASEVGRANIGFFSRDGAKSFVLSQISHKKGPQYLSRNEKVLKQKTDEAFAIPTVGDSDIRDSNGWNSPEHERFFGYAPVLQTIARLLAESDNPYTVSFEYSQTGYSTIVSKILDEIQNREAEKFRTAAIQRFASETNFNLEKIYSPEDQRIRLLGLLNNDDSEAYALEPDLKPNIASGLDEMIRSFLPQHPFLDGINFAGPAFRDYILARGLTSEQTRFSAQLWIDTYRSLYTPILASLYHYISADCTNAEDVELLYESANAGTTNSQSSLLLFISEDDPQTLSIEIASDETNPLAKSLQFRATTPTSIHFTRRLSNAQVITTSEVVLGLKEQPFELFDCEVVAPLIRFETDRVRVRGRGFGYTRLESENPIKSPSTLRVETQNPNLFSVIAPNSKNYPWNPYLSESLSNNGAIGAINVDSTLHVISRILGWFRKDRRKEYGRYKDLIVKHVVGSSTTARYALGFIQHLGALSEKGNLYFIDTEILDANYISWQQIRSGTVSPEAKQAVEDYIHNTDQPPQF
ncbi:MAG: hypothetical protein EKK71_02700 [Candidatus Competibacteraceae bacterium]|nr:MAG: hypothetical protein EKK71_02700 [Candidatus Competibacteraceae bacterium]